jgi:glucokinase
MKTARQYRVGFDLGGTKMLAAVFDEQFKIVGSRRRRTKGQIGVRAGTARIIETIQEALTETGVDRSAVQGIGIGAPGMLDLNKGVLLDAPNLGWHNLPLQKLLSAEFKTTVAIANDVDAGTYAEYRFGSARKARCVVGVFPGTGIGGACVYEGRLLRGKVGSCMEIGHVPVEPNGLLCGCGRHGCLETVASRLAIAAEIAQAAYRGQAPHLRAAVGTDIAEIRSAVIREAIEAGDKAVDKIVRRAARRIGDALIGVTHLLAPDIVVLGGGLVAEMPELFVDEIRQTLETGVTKSFRGTFKVVAARCGDNATALGAAALAADAAAGLDRKSA